MQAVTKTVDEYTLGEKLGEGLTAKVYLATEQSTDKVYAMKVCRYDNIHFNSDILAQVMREVNAASQLNHEHIVKYLKVKEDATMQKGTQSLRVCYILQELQTGGELFDYVVNTGIFQPHFVRHIFGQIIKAVLHMHTAGLAHRDLKSTNILLDRDYNVKVIDLGFAKPLSGEDGVGILKTLVGTRDHMAPEILENRQYRGNETDIFALGVILFTLYSGHPPFEEATVKDSHFKWLCHGMANEFWVKHESYHDSDFFSADFKNLVTLMLSYYPHNRPSIVDIIGHPWMRTGPRCSVEQFQQEMERRNGINREKAIQSRHQNAQDRRRMIVDEPVDPEESKQLKVMVQNLQMREFSPTHAIARPSTFYSTMQPLNLIQALSTALNSKNQAWEFKGPYWRLMFWHKHKFLDKEEDPKPGAAIQASEDRDLPFEKAQIIVEIKRVEGHQNIHAIEFQRKQGSPIVFYKAAKKYGKVLIDCNDAVLDLH